MSKVLIVEDDLSLSEMYRDKFEHEAFEVLTAADGGEGFEKMKKNKPDVVLLDLLMPKVSGFEVLKMAKDDPDVNKIPILVLTNIFADAEDLIKNWGADYFLLKTNATPDEVVKRVNQLLLPPPTSAE
jgi:DNA-binding response OmpR family regulator